VAPTETAAGFGVTATEERIGVTVRVAVPLMPLRVAVRVVEPAATAVASPDATVATVGFELVQVAVVVTFPVVPSLYVAVAANCWVAPTAILAVAGVTAIEVTIATEAGTVTVAVALTPLTVAVTVVEPEVSAVASPAALMLATAGFEDTQVALVVTSAVDLSL
jgi:hypothetical protein